MKKQFDKQTKAKKKALASSIQLALESRLLFDGAVVATATDVLDDKVATQDKAGDSNSGSDNQVDLSAKTFEIPAAVNDANEHKTFDPQPLVDNAAMSAGSDRSPNLLVVDSRVRDVYQLITQPPHNTQVKIIDFTKDGYQQVAQILQNRGDTEQLHLLTADIGGKQWLASSPINSHLVSSSSNYLSDWGDHLPPNAEIVFHGLPNFEAKDWLNQVQALTGIKVNSEPYLDFQKNLDIRNVNQVVKPTDSKELTEKATLLLKPNTVKSLVFIDTSVEDYQSLLNGIDGNAKIILLDSKSDEIQQIANVVSRYNDIEAIHIISHGSLGQLNLGSSVLNLSTMRGQYADELALIGQHLSANADILVYGCNFGQGEVGLRATNELAVRTGGDVADSTNVTGYIGLGGDWTLERKVGAIETQSFYINAYRGLLAQNNTGTWNGTGSSSTSVNDPTAGVTVSFGSYSTGTVRVDTSNQTLNNIAAFNPSTIQNTASLGIDFLWDTNKESTNTQASTDAGTGVITISFSQAVTDPIIHLDRLGGLAGTVQTSMLFTLLTSGITLNRLSGSPHFSVSGNNIQDNQVDQTVGGSYPTSTGESSLTANSGSAAGSVQLIGTFTTVQFQMSAAPNSDEGPGGDGVEIKITFDPTPVANNDAVNTDEDTTKTGSLFGNNGFGTDSDANNDTLTITKINGANYSVNTPITLTHGTLTITNASTGAFTFAPSTDYNGTDSFNYTIADANGGVSTATATITIAAVNDAPVLDLDGNNSSGAGSDYATSYTENASGTPIADTDISITDVDNTTFTSATITITNKQANDLLAVLSSLPGGITASSYNSSTGVITLSGSSSLANYQTAIRNIGFSNSSENPNTTARTITAVLSDGTSSSNTATTTVNVAAVNDAPTVTMPASLTKNEDTTLTIAGIALADPDSGSFGVSVTISIPSGAGTLNFAGHSGVGLGSSTATSLTLTGGRGNIQSAFDNGKITFVPNQDFNASITGPLTLSVSINDNGNTGTGGPLTASGSTTFTVTPVADISNDSITTSEDAAKTFNVLTGTNGATADSFENAGRVVTSVTQGSNGSVSFAADGTITYSPNANFSGTDNFTYTVTSGGVTETATVTMTVNAVNDVPVATISQASYAATEQTPLSLKGAELSVSDADVGSGTVTVTLSVGEGVLTVTSGSSGATVSNSGTGTVTISGTVAQVNALLGSDATSTVNYVNNSDTPSASTILTLSINDGGNTGGGALTSSDTATINLTSVNDAPVNTLPTLYNSNGATLALTGLSITDADAALSPVVVTLSVPVGTLTATTAGGVTVGGSGTEVLTLTGTVANINAFLAGTQPSFVAPSGAFTSTILTMNTNDQGNTGTDPSLTGTATNEQDTDTIVITDSRPSVASVSSPAVAEGGNLDFIISLSNSSSTATTVTLAPASGTGTLGADISSPLQVSFDGGLNFTSIVGSTVSVPSGTVNFTVRVVTVDDALDEPSESISLSASTEQNLSAVTGTGTITDNDLAPGISINDVTVNEAAGTATFTVSLSAASGQAVSVDYSTSDGTAVAGADYTAASGTLSFAAGETAKTIIINLIEDSVFEGNEGFTVNLSNAANGSLSDALGQGTIVDNDAAPSVSSVGAAAAAEGGNLVHTVTLSNASSTASSFAFSLTGASATAGTDFNDAVITFSNGVTLSGGNITVPAGVTSFTVSYATTDDALDELNETTSLTIGGQTGVGTITDNDLAPGISINDVTVNEAAGTATFTVSLSAASGQAVSVDYSTSDGTAVAGADYTAASGTLSFAAGETAKTIIINLSEDSVFEGNEGFTVNLSNAANGSLSDALGQGTIVDNNAAPSVSSVGVAAAAEGGNLVHIVTLSNASSTASSFAFSLTGASATAGTDFNDAVITFSNGVTLSGGNITVPAGVTSFTVSYATTDDALDELNETTSLTIGGQTGVGTITDNDLAPGISINDVTVNEAAGMATFTVSLSAASGQAVSVDYSTSDGTAVAGADYTAASGTLSFAAGETAKTIIINLSEDSVFEGNEGFTVNLSNAANGTLTDALGQGTIVDNDAIPSLSINDATVNEGGTATFTVTLSAASGLPVTVDYNTSNGTAISGVDYASKSGTLTFASGETSKTITVAINDDSVYEGSETFNVNLSSPVNATIADNLGIGTVTDNDLAPSVDNISPSSLTVIEGNTFVHVVTLSNVSNSDTFFAFSLMGNTATAGSDFDITPAFSNGVTLSGGILTVPAGVTSFTVSYATIDDQLNESSETTTLTIEGVTGLGTITDNDSAPSLSINDVTVNEVNGSATFTVTLSAPSGLPVTVDYNTSDSTALAGLDYSTASGSLTFAPGETSKTITVSINDDNIFETSESFNVNLTNPINAAIADGIAIGAIGNDDASPSVTGITAETINEGGTLQHTVTLSNPSSVAISLPFSLIGNTATAGADFDNSAITLSDGVTVSGGNLIIPVGVTSFTVSYGTIDDLLDESDETTLLTVDDVTGVGTIVDNDPTPSMGINDVTVNEGGTATFTVTLSAASELPVTVEYNTSNGTAVSGVDYASKSGTLIFAPGETSKTVIVSTNDDSVYEGSETFNVNLTNSANATIADNLSIGTVTDNDSVPTVLSIVPANLIVVEGNTFEHVVTLSNASNTDTSFAFSLTGNTATAGSDFDTTPAFSNGVTLSGGTLTVPAGVTSFTVSYATIDDQSNESSETTTLTIGGVTGLGTITDNDSVPSLIINDVTVNEALGIATFTVTLSVSSGLPVTVDYTTSDGTALAGADYTVASGSLTFAPGETSKTITILISDDNIFEASENFNVNLSNSANAVITDALGKGTISNDDPAPSVSSVSSPNVSEGGNLDFDVALSNPASTSTTVTLSPASGTGILGTDTDTPLQVSFDGGVNFVDIVGNSVSMSVGMTNFIVRIPTTSDTIFEADETISLDASTSANATPVVGQGTIVDNDAAPLVSSVGAAAAAEGGNLVHIVTLSNASSTASSFAFSLTGASATAGTDFNDAVITFSNGVTLSGGNITVPAGVTSFTVSYATTDDALDELNETTSLTIGGQTGVGTITDNDLAPGISINDVTVNEAAGTATFTVSLSAASGQAVSVDYSTSDGTAVAGADYTAASGTLSFAAGETAKTIIINLIEDSVYEGNEGFTVNLSNAANGSLSDALGQGTIVDNNAAPSVSSVGAAAAAEGGNLVHIVTLSNASSTASSFAFSLTGASATAGTDFNDAVITFSNGVTLSGGNITVPAGVTSFTVSYATTDDALDELNETTSLTIGGQTGVGTITDNDLAPGISINDVTVNEAAGMATFTVSLSAASGQAVSVDYSTSDGTAVAGADYTAASGTLSFAAGETAKTIIINLIEDSVYEGNEGFTVNLSNAANGSLSDALGQGTIVDNDAAPSVSSVDAAAAAEGGNLVHTVTLSNASSTASSFAFSLTGASATAGTDFNDAVITFSNGVTLSGGNITVPAGVTSFTVSYATTDDALDELNETTSLTIGGQTGVGTITDNDLAPGISINDVTVNEAAGMATFTVSLSAASGQAVSVDYSTSDGTAVAGADYTAASGTLSFAAGETAKTIIINLSEDSVFEGNEGFTVNLSNAANGSLSDALGQGTIVDNDSLNISISNSPAVDEDGNLVYAVILSGVSATDITIPLSYAGSAAPNLDYDSVPLSITIPAGATSATITIRTFSDNLVEGNEMLTVSLGAPGNANLNIDDGSGTGLIIDNDSVPIAKDDGPFLVEANTSVRGNVLPNDTDADGGTLKVTQFSIAGVDVFGAGTYAVIPGVGALVINATGEFVFSPLPDYHGPVPQITYTVSDGDNSSVAVLSFSDVRDTKPVAVDDGTFTVSPGSSTSGNVLLNDSDPNHDPLHITRFSIAGVGIFSSGTLVNIPGVGFFIMFSTGEFTFTPNPDYEGSVPTIIYTVSDGETFDTGDLKLEIAANNPNIGPLIMLSNPNPSLMQPNTREGGSFSPFIEPGRKWIKEGEYNLLIPRLYGNLQDYDLYLSGWLHDQYVVELEVYGFYVPYGTFEHSNPNEQLEYAATQINSTPLPSWLDFDPKLLKFSGIPPKGALDVEVMVKAWDRYGNKASATFKVIVSHERTQVGKGIAKIKTERARINSANEINVHHPIKNMSLNEQVGRMSKLSRVMESRALLNSLSDLSKQHIGS